jgi:hypothetical protein
MQVGQQIRFHGLALILTALGTATLLALHMEVRMERLLLLLVLSPMALALLTHLLLLAHLAKF